jgi:hypothetical protein
MRTTLTTLLLLSTLGCATIHRHPLATGIVAGGATALTVGLLTRQSHCPAINGYSGTPNHGYCPEYWPPDTTPGKR